MKDGWMRFKDVGLGIGALLMIMLLAGCASWFSSDSGTPTAQKPVVSNFTASDPTPAAGDVVTFTVTATDPQGQTMTYSWSDDDPANGEFTGSGDSVDWSAAEPGTYEITVEVTDTDGNTTTYSFTIVVSDGTGPPPDNHAPVITSFTVNGFVAGGSADQMVVATDEDGDTLTYTWSDGGGGGTFTGTGATVSYSNNTAGTYTLTVVVSDGEDDATTSDDCVVTAANHPPQFVDGEGTPYELHGDVSAPFATQKIWYHGVMAMDEDGDPITYTWSASGAGTFSDEAEDEDGFQSAFFAADAAGNFIVTLTADDGKGGSSSVSAMTNLDTEEFAVADYPSSFDFVGYAVCLGCHPDQGDEGAGTGWFATNHSWALERSVNGNSHGYRNESCYNCHALGWEPNDSGQGFIDEELTPQFANIQCETCHGGGATTGMGLGHKTVNWNPLVGMMWDETEMEWVPDNDFDSTNGVGCGACHEGSRHGAVEQWAESGHANFALIEGDPGAEVPDHYLTSGSCSLCHNGMQFAIVHRGDEPMDFSGWTIDDPLEDLYISCATCHTPHDAANEKQLRIAAGDGVAIPFSDTDGVPTMVEAGWGNLCIECHNGRRDRGDYDSHIQNGSGHFGPHGNPQGAMFFGLMGADLGVGAATGSGTYEYEHPHLTWNENTCISCHMYRQDYVSPDNPASFGHTFEPDFRNCIKCHTTFVEGEDEAFWTWVEEYTADEITPLLDAFLAAWPAAWKDGDGVPVSRDSASPPDPPVGDGPPRDDPVGNAYRAALWNYFLVLDDATHGVHNPTFSQDLLTQSVASVEELNSL